MKAKGAVREPVRKILFREAQILDLLSFDLVELFSHPKPVVLEESSISHNKS
jgi:hypothetical protein